MKTISTRFLKAALSVLLVVIMLLSSTITGLAAVVDKAETAISIPTGTKLYVDATFWDPSSCRIAAYFYGNGEAWVDMKPIDGNIYECTTPSPGNYTNVIFCRMDKSTTVNNWNNKWNQTGDLVWDGSKSLFTVNAWNGSNNNWKAYTPPVVAPAKPSITKVEITNQHGSGDGTTTKPYLVEPNTNIEMVITASLTAGAAGHDYNVNTDAVWAPFSNNPMSYSGAKSPAEGDTKGYTIYLNAYNLDGETIVRSENDIKTIYIKGAYNNVDLTVTQTGAYQSKTGTVTIDGKAAGTSVTKGEHTLNVTPPAGHKISSITVNDVAQTISDSSSFEKNISFDTATTIVVTYAGSQYSAILDPKGGTQTGNTTVTATYGQKLPTITPPTREGYDFKGYFGAPGGSGQQYYNEDGTGKDVWTTIPNNGVSATIYAHWAIKTFTVEFTSNSSASITIGDKEYKDVTEFKEIFNYGTYDVTVKSVWDDGYVIKKITVDGTDKFSDTTGYTTEKTVKVDIKKKTTINVEYERRGKSVTFTNNGNTQESGEATYVQSGAKVTPPETIEVEGYTFLGWSVDGKIVDDVATYEITKDTTFTATYKQITYVLEVVVPDGVVSVDLVYGEDGEQVTETFTETKKFTLPYGTQYAVRAETITGFRTANDWITDNADFEVHGSVATRLYANLTIEPVLVQEYLVKFDGNEYKYYIEHETVEIPYTVPSGQYITEITPDDAQYADGMITFTMPAAPVDVEVTTGYYRYITFNDDSMITSNMLDEYKAGDKVSFKVTGKDGCTLNSISYQLPDEAEPTVITATNNECSVEFTMPDSDVFITVDAYAKYTVTCQQVAIGNNGTGVTSNFGTVTIKDDNGEVTSGGYANRGKVTFTATETNDKYTFAGFYSDAACTPENNLSYSSTYTADLTGNLMVYALFARKQYITYDSSKTGDDYVKEFTYNPQTGEYTHVAQIAENSSATAISNGAWFLVTNSRNKWENYCSSVATSSTTGTLGIVYTGSDAKHWQLKLNASDQGGFVKITLIPTGNTKISAKAEKVSSDGVTEVYLSSGRRDMADRKATKFWSDSQFMSNNVVVGGTTKMGRKWGDGDNNYDNVESYTTGMILPGESTKTTVQTTIAGDLAKNYYVETFVLYHSDGEIETVVATSVSDTVFEATFNAKPGTNVLVTPIFWYTPEYVKEGNKKEITLYFDRTEADANWGPLVSCYPYSKNKETNVVGDEMGGWPGQLMVPENANTFMTKIVIDEDAVVPQGITLSNYFPEDGTSVLNLRNKLNIVATDKTQTYDYAEPIYLFNEGYHTITYKLKDGSSYRKTDISSYDKYGDINYEYNLLLNESDEPMSLTTDSLENAKSVDKADFYIVAGQNSYNGDYTYDTNYSGQNSSDWHIFDKNGTKLITVLSGSLYDDIGEKNGGKSVLVKELIKKLKTTDEYKNMTDDEVYDFISQATVAIDYNGTSGDKRVDGQWYGTLPDKKYNVNVKVALKNGTITEDDDNEATYGVAYVGEGQDATKEYVVNSQATVTAMARNDGENFYAFEGWYEKNSEGQLVKIFNRPTYNPKVLSGKTYYAVFEKLAEGVLLVNHTRYDYKGVDKSIHSNDGVSSLDVAIYESDVNGTKGDFIDKGDQHTYTTNATANTVQGKYYLVELKVTPANEKSYLKAWYSQTTTASDELTYEEVLTEREYKPGEVVTTSFLYQAQGKPMVIDIFADTITPGLYTTLVYRYRDRFENLVTYTVNNVKLNDKEIVGYPGNEGAAYVPTWLTEYKLYDANGALIDTLYGDEKFDAVPESSYASYTSYNAVDMYAPSEKVTQVYDRDIKWIVNEDYLKERTESKVVLDACDVDATYTIEYQLPGEKLQTITGIFYNTLLYNEIVAPSEYNGNKFSYWQEYTYDENDEKIYGDIIGYREAYNYRVTENRCIEARYGMPTPDLWAPAIDSVTYTREMSDNNDYVYTDYLLAFNSLKGEIVDDLKETKNIEYGLINIRNASYVYSEEQYNADMKNIKDNKLSALTIQYPNKELTKDYIESKVKAIAKSTGHKFFYNNDRTVQYQAYSYDLTQSDTTDFNRLNYFFRYNLDNVEQKGYAFTCYAYIIVDDEVYISSPVNTCIAPYAYTPVNQ